MSDTSWIKASLASKKRAITFSAGMKKYMEDMARRAYEEV